MHIRVHVHDAFEESKHPRGEGGRFGPGAAHEGSAELKAHGYRRTGTGRSPSTGNEAHVYTHLHGAVAKVFTHPQTGGLEHYRGGTIGTGKTLSELKHGLALAHGKTRGEPGTQTVSPHAGRKGVVTRS